MDNSETNELPARRICECCGSEEGKTRPVGEFVVELKEFYYQEEKVLACQSCAHKYKMNRKGEEENLKKDKRGLYMDRLARIIKKLSRN